MEAFYLEQGVMDQRSFAAAFDATFVQVRSLRGWLVGGLPWFGYSALLQASQGQPLALPFHSPCACPLAGQAHADDCSAGAGGAAAAAGGPYCRQPAAHRGASGRAGGGPQWLGGALSQPGRPGKQRMGSRECQRAAGLQRDHHLHTALECRRNQLAVQRTQSTADAVLACTPASSPNCRAARRTHWRNWRRGSGASWMHCQRHAPPHRRRCSMCRH